MKKRFLFVLTLAMVLSALLAPGVRAYHVGGPEGEIVSCSGNSTHTACRGSIYGVLSTMAVESSLSLSCHGQSVSSVYLRQDSKTYVEFGIVRNRNDCVDINHNVFVLICWYDGAMPDDIDCDDSHPSATYRIVSYEEGAPADGNYQFTIYQKQGSLGTFRFRYKRPDGTYRTLPYSYNPPGSWNSSYAWTATEVAHEADRLTDEPGYHHLNTWLLNSALDAPGCPPSCPNWVAASGNYGMIGTSNTMNVWSPAWRWESQISPGGSSGDNINYFSNPNCCT